ncbi:hypothetical protein PC129_g11996 [Phytophthora cactorum]|uniref:Uncharacterized protein n=1 Tax=Phytophthora cactorum TaxID=29920 RepID=A0A329SAH8_9STRA|nr:hypothetical protein PC112_g9982 [Phytophthora cactorum]KAG2860954.1 hypothetical protein PC113_g7607 [Phytophthora cactorum]KAG2915117.1 hypothetical protein PC114_g7946 [Phytophthora cactorum]KAG2920778.1 hypothetical protein PC115_g9713 [Phytophthora cactorum]KAG2946156.1 hypothetical protein PC117_g7858 [Phytophthora cactorum]
MTIANGFILHKFILKKKGEPVPTHAQYMRRLHSELLATTEASLLTNTNAEDLISEPPDLAPSLASGSAIPEHLKKCIRFRKRKRNDEDNERSS